MSNYLNNHGDPGRMHLDEGQLIARACEGDPKAERRLYDTHVDRVYRLAYRMTGDDALAQDLTQEIFIRVFAKLASFRGDAALATWLHAIATRVSLNGIRRVKRIGSHEVDLNDVAANRHSRSVDQELRISLDRAITALPEDLRMVFVMHDLEGFKHHEIAGALALPVGTSKTRLSRARQQLRDKLSAAGWSQAEEDAS